MPSVLDVIENKSVNLSQTDFYAAIIGESPSQGAKSPTLWNAAFKGLELSGMMHPMDVHSEKLANLVELLRKDTRFIGSAVTMPYKIQIIPYLDGCEPEAEAIGAVNCIYREKDKLIGAKKSMSKSIEGKSALLIGTGGAGFAVAAYLASALGSQGQLTLINRSSETRDRLAERLKGRCKIEIGDWPLAPDQVKKTDILVNCSSVGFETTKKDERGAFNLKFYTPLGPVDDSIRIKAAEGEEKRYLTEAAEAIKINYGHSLDVLAAANDPFVFDIIYQPEETLLLFLSHILGYRTLNGVPMNLEQAVIAFAKATKAVAMGIPRPDNNRIRDLMSTVW
jgi:shikimate dehydrogenase